MQNKAGRSFVGIMVLIAILALTIRIAIERIIEFTAAQNESSASGTLKSISIAIENFSRNNKGAYPASLTLLIQAKPAYLDKDYIAASPIKGYLYNCPKLDSTGYICSAVPVNCRLTGKTNYTISTGSLFFSEECAK